MKSQHLHIQLFLIALLFAVCITNASAAVVPPKGKQIKIALVLGGGGAKGAAEVGVLKCIEEAGIKPDIIVGTSIGSIVGGLYSVGYRSAQLDSMFRSQEWLSLLTDRSTDYKDKIVTHEDGVVYVMGIPLPSLRNRGNDGKWRFQLSPLRGDSIVSMLDRMAGLPDSVCFDSLPIPYRCVAVDLESFREVVLCSGHLASSMRASMAIPLAFRPMVIDGRSLVDGGVMNNLPVDVARQMGADFVIAVDLTVNKHEKSVVDNDTLLGSDFRPFPKMELFNMLRWVVERPDLKKYHDNLEQVDIYINPDLSGYSATDFTPKKIAEMIELGEKAGRIVLPKLKKLKRMIAQP